MDLKIALEYNMDVRRYKDKHDGSTSNDQKNPKFYLKPFNAYNAITCNNKVIIVCKVLCAQHSLREIDSKTNDAEYYPIYVVELE